MGRRAAIGGLIAAVVAIGCGSDPEPQPTPTPARTEPPSYPAAFRVPARDARRLARVDAYEELEREGTPVAEVEWDPLPAVVLTEWLAARGIEIGGRRHALVVTAEHARALARLRPSARSLARYYDRFTGDGYPESGQAMLDWLRVFRVAAESADARHVVLIPLID